MHIIVIVIASSWGSKQQNYVIRNDEVIHSRSWMKCFCWCVAETSSTLENTTTKIFSWITPEWLLHIAIERERLFSIVHNYQTPMTLFGDLIRKISLSPQEIIWWPHKINWPHLFLLPGDQYSLEEVLLWPVVLLSKCVHSYTPTANTGMILASYLSEYRKQGQQVWYSPCFTNSASGNWVAFRHVQHRKGGLV